MAIDMIRRALAADVPFSWVAADTVCGVGDIEDTLRRACKGYVLGVKCAYALMKRPEAFEAISIVAPSLWWNDFAVLKLLPDLKARLVETGARPDILVAVGAREQDLPQKAPPGLKLEDLQARVREARMVDAARDLAAALRDLPIGRFEYAEFEGEDHAGALTAGMGRAISFTLRLPEGPI